MVQPLKLCSTNANLSERSRLVFQMHKAVTINAFDQLPNDEKRLDFIQFLSSMVSHCQSNFDHANLLLGAIVARKPDKFIWQTICSSPQAELRESTPIAVRTSGIANSSERHDDIDPLLGKELGDIWYDIPDFRHKLLALPKNYDITLENFWDSCENGLEEQHWIRGSGWRSWPRDVTETSVGNFLKRICEQIITVLKKGEQDIQIHR